MAEGQGFSLPIKGLELAFKSGKDVVMCLAHHNLAFISLVDLN